MKKIFIVVYLLICCLCFADGFNNEALKNPPKSIKHEIKQTTGSHFWYSNPLHSYQVKEYKCEVAFFSRIVQKTNGIRLCQIIFENNKSEIEGIQIKFKDGRIVSIPKKNAGVYNDENGVAHYYFTGELPVQQYVDYFVKDMPQYVLASIPKFFNGKIELPIQDKWLQAFLNMKILFSISNEVQVQFR